MSDTTGNENSPLSIKEEPADISLDEKIVELEGKLQTRKSRNRIQRIFFIVLFGGFGAFLSIGVSDPIWKAVLWVGFAAFGYFSVEFSVILFGQEALPLEVQLDVLKTRKRIQVDLRKKGKGNKPSDLEYFDRLVEINLGNLAEYYGLVKTHTNNSFRVSIISGIIGFGLIVIGLIMGFLLQGVPNSGTATIGYITSGAGIVTEFISAVFFYLYNQTVRQLKEYHDSLLAVQNLLLSFKLVGDIKSESERTNMISKMLSYLVGDDTGSKPKYPIKEN
jgi:hypothetical protein